MYITEVLSEEEYDTKIFDLKEDPGKDLIEIPEGDPVDSTGKYVYDSPFMEMWIPVEVILPQKKGFKS